MYEIYFKLMLEIKVALCDNNWDVLNKLKSLFRCLALRKKLDIVVDEFDDGRQLLKNMKNTAVPYDIYILEMVLENADGYQLAKEIRQTNKEAVIIVFSETDKYVFKGYALELFAYHLKSFPAEAFLETIQHAIQRVLSKETFFIKTANSRLKLYLNEIYYFMISDNFITMATKRGKYCFYGKLKEIIEEIGGKGFIYCNRNIVVNANKITRLENHMIYMENGEEIIFSKRNKRELLNLFHKISL